MATTTRKNKASRGGGSDSRRGAWSNSRASPALQQNSSPRASNLSSPNIQSSFPPLVSQPPASNNRQSTPVASDPNHDRTLANLAGITGTTITLLTKTSQKYEGVVVSTGAEDDTSGVTLKDVKDISNPGAPLKDNLFIAVTNIDAWSSGPADTRIPNGSDSFRTDTDISQKTTRRDRELQTWHPASDAASTPTTAPPILPVPGNYGQGHTDDVTFGPGASSAGASWDQFAVNAQLFGVHASFDEEAYTTKLDRTSADYKERERKAQKIANEIIGSTTSNPHVAEERNMIVDDTNLDEEQKYGAVVRGANAYVPPAARKSNPPAGTSNASGTPGVSGVPNVSGGSGAANANTATSPPKQALSIPKVHINGPDSAGVAQGGTLNEPNTSSPASPPSGPSNKPPADPVPAFRDFVTNEKQRLTQKRQALVKSEMDKCMSELVKFSQSFKLNKPIPEDLVSILAKDEDKQRLIREKTTRDATSTRARTIGSSPVTAAGAPPTARAAPLIPVSAVKGADTNTRKLPPPGSAGPGPNTAVPATPKQGKTSNATSPPAKTGGKPGINMYIQPIPPFKGSKTRPSASMSSSTGNVPTVQGSGAGSGSLSTPPPTSKDSLSAGLTNAPSSINRLNINASSFRPNPTAKAFSPVGGSPRGGNANTPMSPKAKPVDSPPTPNPFFGTRVIKRTVVNVKDDFNPFRNNKVVEASQVAATWPYTGKRYLMMFPPPQHPIPQHSPHIVSPAPHPMPPQPYDEDSAAQASRGYVYAYPPYGYPAQPMMSGMAPTAPPGGYIPGPFIQPMPYPPSMPPPNGQPMYGPGMAQMPPPGAYMPPPPGSYPPPNGAGPRPSMPPTPIPAHAHPYYHQSPQLPHAVPYPMMMPPSASAVQQPHPYEAGPAPPVSMGGVGHA